MIQTREILASSTAVATGTTVSTLKAGGTFQAIVSGSGAVSATVVVSGSLYAGQWITLATMKLNGFDVATEGFVHAGAWAFYRADLVQISGTGATCSVNMGGEV